MSHNNYLSVVAVAGLVSWLAWTVVIGKLDPFESKGLALGLFFLTLFIALTCTFSIVGFYLRLWLNHNEFFYQHIHLALRQGFLLAVIVNGCLTFQILRVLTWWSGVLLILTVTFVEMYFVAKDPEL